MTKETYEAKTPMRGPIYVKPTIEAGKLYGGEEKIKDVVAFNNE
jgi:hypothetical protein